MRRLSTANMTPAQLKARNEFHKARTWAAAVSIGLADVMKNVYDRQDANELQELIAQHMFPAIEEMEAADKRYADARKGRSLKVTARRAKKKAA